MWLDASKRSKDPDPVKWNKFVELLQHAFATGELQAEISWSVLVVIPKGCSGFRGIGLLEVILKVISSIIDSRLKAEIEFDDSLHGFRAERGTSTACIEAKLHMQLACAQRKTLYQIFIDLAKVYDTLDRGRTLDILEGYGVGRRIIRLLTNFWAHQLAVARQSGYHSSPFEVNIGVTQGDIPSPTIFNVVCDALVRAWKAEVTAGNLSSERSRAIEEIVSKLYADDGVLTSTTDPELQDSLHYLVELFERVNLKTNTSKTKSMTCQPRPEQGHISDHAYKRMMVRSGASYRARQKRCVTCNLCDAEMAQGYLSRSLQQVHGSSETPVVDCLVATMEDVEQSD
jgi:hypothetical protein